ncbi:MAG: tRNA (adenosine(37)-N6)-threonylcarbamoyltransferase complex dimerization subunit type 1 TsaB [Clostridia bacterium]
MVSNSLILSIDTSAKSASCAISKDDKLIAQYFINNKLTHSTTLMPMIENMLISSDISLSDIDLIAISAGPGSFTGIRIGICTVKGLALQRNIECQGVSTLEAIANSITSSDIICCVMDARCGSVYNAIFKKTDNKIARLCDDRIISISDLSDILTTYDTSIILAGDGAELCYESLKLNNNIYLAPEKDRYQTAFGVALSTKKGYNILSNNLLPIYLREPQAVRERKEK